MIQDGLEHERDYVAGLYRRLDDLKAEAERQLASIRAQGGGGTHQSRTERDTFARLYEDRIAQLREVTERLAFGRLQLAASAQEEAVDRYIGRIGLRDEEQHPLLLDWRVPQASAFYQATAAEPMGARARRHLITRGRDVVRVEDEIFDPELLDEASEHQGEGALLAALGAERTGRMNDIVATIQAEQDRIIRSELAGVLVVQGGPGTGKTAVALHRAAYLLYSHRKRLGNAGVLIVGPSASFLHYIESVLPSLGETGVVLASLGGLLPGIAATVNDEPAVAALKGRSAMAELIARAVRSRQRVPDSPVAMIVNGDTVMLEPATVERAIARARETRKPYNEARVTFVKTALAELTKQWAAQLRAQGNTIDGSDMPMLQEDLRTAHDVRVALNTAWLPLTPEKLLQDLYARPHWLAELTPAWSDEQRALLRRGRDAPFTVEDVPLLDEAAELLGEFDPVGAARRREEKQQRKRDIENAEAAIENMQVEGMIDAKSLAANFAETGIRATTSERAGSDRTWTYGHIVVDEAQELSPMQWRLLLRRCPLRSFTIVGDIAQASAATASSSWRQALRPLIGRSAESQRWRLEELSVNYRTPRQIAEVAEEWAIASGLPVTPSQAVRSTRWPVEEAESLMAAVSRHREEGQRGTLAVIARGERLEQIHSELRERFGELVAFGSESLLAPIVVLAPQEAKGLEFDDVVIVDPASIAALPRGAGALYVAMTRATQRLTLVGQLPPTG
ncbi:AAA family ATPase [Salinibacterium sp. SYSU T00001]|uniref:HelD family protein n=1 Tax=Homoserinimonas sedimenticola TaxID=2986805 RepID=UPI002236240D|nr:UvrD-helicase domain-containing protein [Salinibacterium sedimenticola]MCW4386734.1 AAA family ATPase [Salinibacterium sedimenticola]